MVAPRLRLFPNFLLLISISASSLDLSALQYALGNNLIAAHHLTPHQHHQLFQSQLLHSQPRAQIITSAIICCQQQHRHSLQLLLTQNNITSLPIFLSKRLNQVCLIVSHPSLLLSSSTSNFVNAYSIVDVWSPLFPILKISSLVIDSINSISPSLLPSLSLSMLKGVKIRIFYETGLLQPLHLLTLESLVDDLRHVLQSDTLILESLHTLTTGLGLRSTSQLHHDSAAPTLHLWSTLLTSLLSRLSLSITSSDNTLTSLCHFNELNFSPHAEHSLLTITGFDDIDPPSSSFDQLLCLVTVISISATQSESLHITLSLKPSLHSLSPSVAPLTSFSVVHAPELLQSGSNELTTGRVYDAIGLNGSRVIVGVSDTGVDDLNCYLSNTPGRPRVARDWLNSSTPLNSSSSVDLTQRKLVQYVAFYDGIEESPDGHGTHVTGVIIGSPSPGDSSRNGDGSGDGVARGARVAFLDLGEREGDIVFPPDDFFQFSRVAGASVESMSWGTTSTEFTFFDAYIDEQVYTSATPLLVTIAVGNSGPNPGSIYSPALSKNSLHIGASDGQTLADFSSRGPIFDGRYGVDLLAPGVATSAQSTGTPLHASCLSSVMVGTSIASPSAAGAAALVLQYFRDPRFWASHCQPSYPLCSAAFTPSAANQTTLTRTGLHSPSSSLLKATLIHSGQNIDPSHQEGYRYPGPEQGYGRIQLNQVLVYEGVTPYGFDLFVDEIVLTNHSSVNYTVQILGSTSPLKVTICWTDPPNSVMAARQLLNDVDLTLTGPSGQRWFGNNVTGGDEVNTAEIIEIISPRHGAWVVNVSMGEMGSSHPSQRVSIVITSVGRVTPHSLTDLPSSRSLSVSLSVCSLTLLL
jgi:hypothetical protein